MSNIEKGRDFFLPKVFFKIMRNPIMYPGFPQIPSNILDKEGNIKGGFSICKKGSMYYILNDGKGQYLESLGVIDPGVIVFSFSQYELDLPHLGQRIGQETLDIIEGTEELNLYTNVLRSVVDKGKFDFGDEDSLYERLFDLYIYTKDQFFGGWLEQINLCKVNDSYVVVDTDIDFTKNELDKIKALV